MKRIDIDDLYETTAFSVLQQYMKDRKALVIVYVAMELGEIKALDEICADAEKWEQSQNVK